MAEGFKSSWEPGWTARLDSIRMSQLQLVTFASIVEGEARADDERETIAGVYHNRLRIGMALQADPTVQYAICAGHREAEAPALREGLPVSRRRTTPTFTRDSRRARSIRPSLRSLEASLYPADVPYLYFVAGPDGRHVFARTYEEHRRNIARIRRGQ